MMAELKTCVDCGESGTICSDCDCCSMCCDCDWDERVDDDESEDDEL